MKLRRRLYNEFFVFFYVNWKKKYHSWNCILREFANFFLKEASDCLTMWEAIFGNAVARPMRHRESNSDANWVESDSNIWFIRVHLLLSGSLVKKIRLNEVLLQLVIFFRTLASALIWRNMALQASAHRKTISIIAVQIRSFRHSIWRTFDYFCSFHIFGFPNGMESTNLIRKDRNRFLVCDSSIWFIHIEIRTGLKDELESLKLDALKENKNAHSVVIASTCSKSLFQKNKYIVDNFKLYQIFSL